MKTKNKCDSCQQQFSCTAEDGQCDTGKEKYIPCEQDDLGEIYFVYAGDIPEAP
jgi:hypothetical protein